MALDPRQPVALRSDISLREILGWNGTDSPLWSRVRATQLECLLRALPMSCGAVVVQAVVLMIAFARTPSGPVVFAWGGVTLLLVASRLHKWRRASAGGPLREASPKLIRAATLQAATMALSWAGILMYLFPRSSDALQMLVACMHMGLMGGGAFIFATVPAAAFTYVGVLMTAMLINEITRWSGLPELVYPICAIYMVVIVRGVLSYTRTLIWQVLGEAELREHGEVIGLLLKEYEQNGSDWLWEVDAECNLTLVSERMAQVCCRTAAELRGANLLALFGAGSDRSAHNTRQLAEQFGRRQPFRDLVVPVAVPGDLRWWALTATPRFDRHGSFVGYRGVGADVTDVRRSQDQIAHMARYDALTGLLNRGTLQETLEEVMSRANRLGTPCALMFIDLDRFKAVNDTLGHPIGDRLLRECASRIELEAGVEARVGRLGGDEFALILADAGTQRRVFDLADRLIARVSMPYVVDGQTIAVGASIGIAFGPTDGCTVDDLLSAADLALYRAKETGRGVWCRYLPSMRHDAEERLELERELRNAVADDELRLVFQPIVCASSGETVAMEALLRWTHPRLGPISPAKFIPIAEEAGLIHGIGEWVIRNACAWAARWPDTVRVSVNLSPQQLGNSSLVSVVVNALACNGLAPDRLELEITENVFLQETPQTAAVLKQLSGLGVRIALDDFGTGYSSLGYLRKARFSTIKIDRSFVETAVRPDSDGAAIIRSIVSLAKSLGMDTVAEGTESLAEVEAVRALGCDKIQGFYFSRPLEADAAIAFAATGAQLASFATAA
jgi:diguanylate cyclase (GGDEF)-like protein/PAS domain S-box-containing protein